MLMIYAQIYPILYLSYNFCGSGRCVIVVCGLETFLDAELRRDVEIRLWIWDFSSGSAQQRF